MIKHDRIAAGVVALAVAIGSLAAFAQTPAPAPKTVEQKKQARATWEARFKATDKNSDGGLSVAELEGTLEFRNVSTNFNAMDANKDGKVTREEYRAWTKANRAAKKQP